MIPSINAINGQNFTFQHNAPKHTARIVQNFLQENNNNNNNNPLLVPKIPSIWVERVKIQFTLQFTFMVHNFT